MTDMYGIVSALLQHCGLLRSYFLLSRVHMLNKPVRKKLKENENTFCECGSKFGKIQKTFHGTHTDIITSLTNKQNIFYFHLKTTPTLFVILRIPAKMKLPSNTFSFSFQTIVAVCFGVFLVISGGSSCAQAQVSSFAFERFRCVRVK